MTDTQKIAIYVEGATMAGRRCWDEDLIERESDDIFVVEGDDSELLDHALSLLASKKQFDQQAARTILDSLEDAPRAIEVKLREVGATEGEREEAWSWGRVELVRAACGSWEGALAAVRREMADRE